MLISLTSKYSYKASAWSSPPSCQSASTRLCTCTTFCDFAIAFDMVVVVGGVVFPVSCIWSGACPTETIARNPSSSAQTLLRHSEYQADGGRSLRDNDCQFFLNRATLSSPTRGQVWSNETPKTRRIPALCGGRDKLLCQSSTGTERKNTSTNSTVKPQLYL